MLDVAIRHTHRLARCGPMMIPGVKLRGLHKSLVTLRSGLRRNRHAVDVATRAWTTGSPAAGEPVSSATVTLPR